MQPPIIDLNFLAVEEDRKRLLEGVQLSRRIASSDKLKRIIVQELNPGKSGTDEQIIESMKNTIESYGHPFATAPMGPNGEQNGRGGFSRKGVQSGGAESCRCLNIS